MPGLCSNFLYDVLKLFFVINPHIIVPFFLSCTQNYTNSERDAMGRRMCLYGLGLGLAFGLGGNAVLQSLGVSIPAFRMSGGVLLAVAAWGLLYSDPSPSNASPAEVNPHADISLCPLAFPMFVGPATITKIISMVQQSREGGLLETSAVFAALVFLIIVTYLFITFGSSLVRLLGHSGLVILQKVAGILLIAMSLEMIAGGAKDYFWPEPVAAVAASSVATTAAP